MAAGWRGRMWLLSPRRRCRTARGCCGKPFSSFNYMNSGLLSDCRKRDADTMVSERAQEVIASPMALQSNPRTPRKAVRTSIYPTPTTTGKSSRKAASMFMIHEPVTPVAQRYGQATSQHYSDPWPVEGASIAHTRDRHVEVAEPSSPSPTSSHTSTISLGSEILTMLATVELPPGMLTSIEAILTRDSSRFKMMEVSRDRYREALNNQIAKNARLGSKIDQDGGA